MTELGNVSSLLGFGLDRKVLVCEVKVGCLVAFTNICVKFNPQLLTNSSPSPFQSKSNGQGVDFVFPLSQEQQQQQQEQQPSPKSTTRKYTTDLKFGT